MILKRLRFVRVLKIREFGYSWYKFLSIELYEYQTEERDKLDYNATERRLWLEGLEWKLYCSRSSTEPVQDNELSEAELPEKLKTSRAWDFEDVSIFILKGPEADDADKEPRKLGFYNDLEQYGELLWRQWPESEFSDQQGQYRALLCRVGENDPKWDYRNPTFKHFVRSPWGRKASWWGKLISNESVDWLFN